MRRPPDKPVRDVNIQQLASSNNTLNAFLGGRPKSWMTGGVNGVQPSPRAKPRVMAQSAIPSPAPYAQPSAAETGPPPHTNLQTDLHEAPSAGFSSVTHHPASEHPTVDATIPPLQSSQPYSSAAATAQPPTQPGQETQDQASWAARRTREPTNIVSGASQPDRVPAAASFILPDPRSSIGSHPGVRRGQAAQLDSSQYAHRENYPSSQPVMQAPLNQSYGVNQSQTELPIATHAAQLHPAPLQTRHAKHSFINLTALEQDIQAYLRDHRFQANMSPDLVRPRLMLLLQACAEGDLFYLFLHQVFCIWSFNATELVSLGLSSVPVSSFQVLVDWIRDNRDIAPTHLLKFTSLPCPWSISTQCADHRSVLEDVRLFLTHLETSWTRLLSQVMLRSYPPLVDELVSQLGLKSPVLQHVVFVACRRNLGVRDGPLLRHVDSLFFRDRNLQRSIPGHQGEVEQIRARNAELAREYHQLFNGPLGQALRRPSAQAPPGSQQAQDSMQADPLNQMFNQTGRPPPSAPAPILPLPNMPHAPAQRQSTLNTALHSAPTIPTLSPPVAFHGVGQNSVNHVSLPMSAPPHAIPASPISPLVSPTWHNNQSTQGWQLPNIQHVGQYASTRPHIGHPDVNTAYQPPSLQPVGHPHMGNVMLPPTPHHTVVPDYSNLIDKLRLRSSSRSPCTPRLPSFPQLVSPIHQALPPPRQAPSPREPTANPPINGPLFDGPKLYQVVEEFACGPKTLPHNLTSSELTFTIKQPHLPLLLQVYPGTRPNPRSYFPGCIQYRLRCVQMKTPDVKHGLSDWVVTETTWPDTVLVDVNNKNVDVKRKMNHGKDVPLDLNPYLFHDVNRENRIRILLAQPSKHQRRRHYAVAIEIISISDHQSIVTNCLSSQRLDASRTLQSIVASLSSQANDDDLAVVASDLTIDITDPFMAKIWDEPVRGSSCLHRECFDLETFLGTRNNSPKIQGFPCAPDVWKCPLCGRDARPGTLVVDDFLVSVRRSLAAQGRLGTKAILVSPDGSWRPKALEESRKRKAGDMSDPDDTDDEDGAATVVKRPKEIVVIDLDD